MWLIIILVVMFLSPAPSLARTLTSLELIENAYRNAEIDYREALNYKVAAVLRPEGLPEGYRSRVPIKSATPIIMEARSNRHLLSPDNARLLGRGRADTLTVLYRSGITLLSYISPGRHFRIHYTIEGDDAVPADDANGDNIPDYVEKFAGILDHVWEKEIVEMGYDAPPSDGVWGGDCLLDVYLANLHGYYGLTQLGDDNIPSTVYMILENDYAGFPPNLNPGGLQEGDMEVTAAHEFFHAIQFQISDDIALNGWWMEASATWMEDYVYPEVNDYVNYINCWFSHPEWPLITYGLYPPPPDQCDLYYPYGTAIWIKHMTEKYGSTFVFDVWNKMKVKTADSALSGVENTLTERGSSLAEGLKELRVANVTFTYSDGPIYQIWDKINPDRSPAGVSYDRTYMEFSTSESITNVSVDILAARYYYFSAPGGSGTLNIDIDGDSNITVMIIGVRPGDTCSEDICYDVTELVTDSLNNGSIAINGFSSSGPYPGVIVIPLNFSTKDQGSFGLTATYSPAPANSTATIEIRPAATSVVTGDGGAGKQQYSLILRDGAENQILESGTTWSANSSSVCTDSSSVCINSNGFATASKAITGATVTAALAGSSASAAFSAGNPARMNPGNPRNCTIKNSSDGGCFIATAAFGSPLHPYVGILREFRDRYLLTNSHGRDIVSLYYFYSPPIAEKVAKYAMLRAVVKIYLIPAIIFSGFMVKTTMVEKIVVGVLLISIIGVQIILCHVRSSD